MRLEQSILREISEEERKSLVGKRVKDYSSLNLGIAEIKEIKDNKKSYEVTVSASKGCGEYTFLEEFTQDLDVVD